MPQAMMWVFAVLIVLAMGGIALLAAGRGEPMRPAYDDRPDARIPRDPPITADDLRRVRFSLAFRGYRMSEVDALLARLALEQEMRGGRPAAPPAPEPARESAPEPAPEPAPESAPEPAPESALPPPPRSGRGRHLAPEARDRRGDVPTFPVVPPTPPAE